MDASGAACYSADTMPYADPEKRKAMNRERNRRRRKSAEFREKESQQKAEWFQENKARLREKQRQYRSGLREQSLLNFQKNNKEDE